MSPTAPDVSAESTLAHKYQSAAVVSRVARAAASLPAQGRAVRLSARSRWCFAGVRLLCRSAPRRLLNRTVMEVGGFDPMIILDEVDMDYSSAPDVRASFIKARSVSTPAELLFHAEFTRVPRHLFGSDPHPAGSRSPAAENHHRSHHLE
jgi:hypothetical protein